MFVLGDVSLILMDLTLDRNRTHNVCISTFAKFDPVHCKIFVHGLGSDATIETLVGEMMELPVATILKISCSATIQDPLFDARSLEQPLQSPSSSRHRSLSVPSLSSLRSWTRVDCRENYEVIKLDKLTVMRCYNLPSRDF